MSEEPKKKGLFARFKEGLAKTRDNIGNKIDQLVHNYKEMDDDFYEDLQDILIMGDVGVETSADVIARLKNKVRENRTDDPERVRGLLSEVIAEMMGQPTPPLKSPAVLLVVGVNGVGKTTTIGKLAARLKAQGKSVQLAAADTFRAARTRPSSSIRRAATRPPSCSMPSAPPRRGAPTCCWSIPPDACTIKRI